jgi:serine/threonine protein kinase
MDETLPDPSPKSRREQPEVNPGDETQLGAGQQAGMATPTSRPHSTFQAKERDLSGTLLGDYRLVRKLAVGGMGEVYEGVQLKLDRQVAIKLLSEELSHEEEFLARFEREAKSAAALNHPNVVQVYDFGQAHGHYYFVMELVDGTDLAEFVKQHGKLTVPDALNYLEQAVAALKFAVEHAIIHRDVKPANLMLTRDGVVKVSDLGLAKKLTDDSDVTMTGVGMGSPHFLAPEQADDAAHVDHRADVYALGVTLLYLLTGRRPFEGASNFSVVLAHANKPLPTGGELGTPLPDEVERFIKRMTAKRPEGRYQDYDELLTDLRRVKAGLRPSFNWQQFFRDPQHLQRIALGTAAVIIVALAAPLAMPNKKPATANRPPSWPADKAGSEAPSRPKSDASVKDEATQMRPRAGRRLPVPLPEPAPPERMPLREGPIPQMLMEADRFAKANPEQMRAIIDRYWQISRKSAGTAWEAEVRLRTDNAITAHQLATHAAMEKLQAEMEAHLRAGKPQAAYDVWRKFPLGLQTPETHGQIEQILQRSFPPQFQPQSP